MSKTLRFHMVFDFWRLGLERADLELLAEERVAEVHDLVDVQARAGYQIFDIGLTRDYTDGNVGVMLVLKPDDLEECDDQDSDQGDDLEEHSGDPLNLEEYGADS